MSGMCRAVGVVGAVIAIAYHCIADVADVQWDSVA